MSDILKSISLDGFSKKVNEYFEGDNITFTPDENDPTKITISAGGADLSNYYTKGQVDDLIGGLESVTMQTVDELPTSGESNVIYLVPKDDGTGEYDEYVWLASDGKYEKIGDTAIDLSDYQERLTAMAAMNAGNNAVKINMFTGSEEYENEVFSQGSYLEFVTATPEVTIKASDNDDEWTESVVFDVDLSDYAKTADVVAKETGKGLSTNDFTNADKAKLDSLTPSDYLTCDTLSDCDTFTNALAGKQDTLTKASLLSLLGYEEVELTLTDTDGGTITKTILAKVED